MVWVRVWPWPWGRGSGSWWMCPGGPTCLHNYSRRQSLRQRGLAVWGQGLAVSSSPWWSVEPWGSTPARDPRAKPPPHPRPSGSKLGPGRAPPRRSVELQVKGRRPSTWQQARPRPRLAPCAKTRATWIESQAPASDRVGRRVEIVHERVWYSWEPLKVRGCSLLKREVKPPAQPAALPPKPAPKKPARAPAGREPRGEEGGKQPREIELPAAQEAGAAGAEEGQTPKAGAAETEDEQTQKPEGEKTPGAEGEPTPEVEAAKAEGEPTSGTEGEKTPEEVEAAKAEGEETLGTEGEKTLEAEGKKTPGAEGEETSGGEGKTPGAEGELTPEAGAAKAEGEETSGTEGEKTPEVGATEKEAEEIPATEGEQTPNAEGEETPGAEGQEAPGAEGQEPQDQGQGQLLELAEIPTEKEKVSEDQEIEISDKRAEEGEVLEEGELERNKEKESFSAEGGNPSERTEAQFSELAFEATTDSPANTAEVKEAYVNQREYEEESLVKSDAHKMTKGEQPGQGAEEGKQTPRVVMEETDGG